jgi:hypothetical protein
MCSGANIPRLNTKTSTNMTDRTDDSHECDGSSNTELVCDAIGAEGLWK